jgi:hypothetical protein
MPRLENWFVETLLDNKQILYGIIYNDNRFLDGKIIHTSVIVSIDEEKGIAQTQNTLYQLGTPSQWYQEYLNSLKDVDLG